MYVMYMMVRKQLYIEQGQERALKRRAKALGVSEADLVRQALDALLQGEHDTFTPPGSRDALQEFIDRASQIAGTQRGGHLPRYRREDIYEERESRWVRHP